MPGIRIEDINAGALSAPAFFIKEAEDGYYRRLGEIAEYITKHEKLRIVLIAGPSGSGKTTSANILSEMIVSLGKTCPVVSLDNFYKSADSAGYPLTDDGKPDFESPFALDDGALAHTLTQIANGEAFSIPKYDFKLGRRTEVRHFPPIENGCVVIEGLHALNPIVFSSLPKERVFKIYVGVLTEVDRYSRTLFDGADIRFVRRLVRDSIYRGADAERTLAFWEGVVDGERKYLEPVKANADVEIDTFHSFELPVLRPFAEALITAKVAANSEYAERILSNLQYFDRIDLSLIPETSLIKEFIPGGKFEDAY